MNKKTSNLWEGAKNMIIMYVYTDEKDFNLFQSAVDKFKQDSHLQELKVIVLSNNKKEDIHRYSLYSYFHETDISFFGKVKKRNNVYGDDDLEQLRKKYYDLFLCIGTPSKKVAKWIDGFCIPNRIGLNCEKETYFMLNLKTTLNSFQEKLTFVVSTLKKISCD